MKNRDGETGMGLTGKLPQRTLSLREVHVHQRQPQPLYLAVDGLQD
jgi:hypothetical protein